MFYWAYIFLWSERKHTNKQWSMEYTWPMEVCTNFKIKKNRHWHLKMKIVQIKVQISSFSFQMRRQEAPDLHLHMVAMCSERVAGVSLERGTHCSPHLSSSYYMWQDFAFTYVTEINPSAYPFWVRWKGGPELWDYSSHVEREGLILILWVLPGDTGGGGDEQQDWSNGGEFPWF